MEMVEWTHDKEITLSYYRLLSREKAMTEELSKKREILENEFLSLGFGPYPGGIEYTRYCRDRREKLEGGLGSQSIDPFD